MTGGPSLMPGFHDLVPSPKSERPQETQAQFAKRMAAEVHRFKKGDTSVEAVTLRCLARILDDTATVLLERDEQLRQALAALENKEAPTSEETEGRK